MSELDPGFYDVRSDPRYLGLTEEERSEYDEKVAEEMTTVAQALGESQAIMETVMSPGWKFIEHSLQRDMERASNEIARADKPEDIKFIKGQMVQMKRVLDLPRKMEQDVRRRRGELATLEGEQSSA